jgi:hypothetical protein
MELIQLTNHCLHINFENAQISPSKVFRWTSVTSSLKKCIHYQNSCSPKNELHPTICISNKGVRNALGQLVSHAIRRAKQHSLFSETREWTCVFVTIHCGTYIFHVVCNTDAFSGRWKGELQLEPVESEPKQPSQWVSKYAFTAS